MSACLGSSQLENMDLSPWLCSVIAPYLPMGALARLTLVSKLDDETALLKHAAWRLWRVDADSRAYASLGARCRDANAREVSIKFRATDRGTATVSLDVCRAAHATPTAWRKLLKCRLRSLGVRVLRGEGDGRLHVHDERARPLSRDRLEAARRAAAAAAAELLRLKTCRACYGRRGALMPTADDEPALVLECHACGRTAVVARDCSCEWLRWARRCAWEKLNVVAQDFGVKWYTDSSPTASRARARSAGSESRGLRALSSRTPARPHCASDGEDGDG